MFSACYVLRPALKKCLGIVFPSLSTLENIMTDAEFLFFKIWGCSSGFGESIL